MKDKTPLTLGSRWVVEAIDQPDGHAPMYYPVTGIGARLVNYHFELHFAAFLAFWTGPADSVYRVYAVVRDYDWDMLGEWAIAEVNNTSTCTAVTEMSVTITNARSHRPAVEAHKADCEVHPPTATALLAYDART